MAPWTLALILDRLSGRRSFSSSPTIGASVLALPNPSPGLDFPALPSLHRRHEKRWIHRRLQRHRPPASTNWARTFKPLSTTLGLLPQVFQPPRRHLRRGQGSFHRHGHCQRLQRPTSMDLYRFNSAPTVRENHTVTGSHSGRRNIAIPDQLSRFIGPSAFISALTTSSADTTTPPLPA